MSLSVTCTIAVARRKEGESESKDLPSVVYVR